jgi:hypothetical protein
LANILFYFLIFEILFFQERSEEKDGRITTETKRHEHHEEIDDNEEPEDDRPASDTSSIHEVVKETRNNYTTLQDEDQVSFFSISFEKFVFVPHNCFLAWPFLYLDGGGGGGGVRLLDSKMVNGFLFAPRWNTSPCQRAATSLAG